MKNADVIEKFIYLQGEEKSKTQHLYIDTNNRQLINYNTVIAQWNGTEEQTKELVIDVNYYSQTTSKIQGEIIKQVKKARKNGYIFFLVMNGTSDRIEQFTSRLKAE